MQMLTVGPGSGFTQRQLTLPDGDIAEDQAVTQIGTYSATAPLNAPGPWIMQMIAFRTLNTTPATVTGVSPNSGSAAGGTAVTIAGANFASGAAVAFGNNKATNVNILSSTEITATTPAGSDGSVTVTVTNPGTQGGSLADAFTYIQVVAAPITYVQSNYATPQTPQSTVSVTFTDTQSTGDLNVVVVGWNDSSAVVNEVTDSSGNTYALGVGPTIQSGTATQSIYYAKKIAGAMAGKNTVTVTFAGAATSPDIRILEYAGADPIDPVDVTAANVGNSAFSSSGSAITTNANDLLFGANLVQMLTVGPGSGFTQRQLTLPDGDVAEDQAVTQIGTYSATAPLNAPGPWIMQMIAFRNNSTGTGVILTAPSNLTAITASASQINLSWNASASNAGVANYVVQRCGGADCNAFTQIAAPTGTSYSDTGLASGTSYSYRVQALDESGNASGFSNTATAVTQGGSSQGPSTPTGVVASAASGSDINVTWAASSSSAGNVNYVIQRCEGSECSNFAQIGTSPGTSYNNTGLSPHSSYMYQVQAVDDSGATSGYSSPAGATTGYTFPLKVAAGERYLTDQNGIPFLIMGDSPQALIGNLGTSDMNTYMANRQSLGFNTLWVNLLCDNYTGCNSDGTTYDGVAPFTKGSSPSNYDLSTPNEAYFSIVDNMVQMAASYNLVVLLDPIETGGWLVTLENNGSTKAYNYGVYIGNRYKSFPNIIWLHGNDFQTWASNSNDNNLVKQVMAGIASVDSNHLQTIELNFDVSYSNQDAALSSVLTVDSAYSYFETYDMVLQSYQSSPVMPTYLVEANYEGENDTQGLPSVAGTYVLREQAYWTMLSGGTGEIYGNRDIWPFSSGWQDSLNSPGALQIQYINQLFDSFAWWQLVPDNSHQVVTGGYGTYDAGNYDLTAATYCTVAWNPNGSLAMTYCPKASTLLVNLAKFGGPVTAQWYDPSNGTYTAVAGSPFANTGIQSFATPGNNHDGDLDWVLVLHM